MRVQCLQQVARKRANVSTIRFPPPTPHGLSSPTSSVLSNRSDFLRPISPHFVILRLAIPRVVRLLCRKGRTPLPTCFVHPVCSGTSQGNRRISQVSVSPLLSIRLVLRPRSDQRFRPLRNADVVPALHHYENSNGNLFRGSIARLLNFLCNASP